MQVVGRDRSPFGPTLLVRIPGDSLSGWPASDGSGHRAVRAARSGNDLGRSRVRVSTNTITANKYRGLNGNGILVNINDTGVDGGHPDLSGRLTADNPGTLVDSVGHGTHVAGIIASFRREWPRWKGRPWFHNGANFRAWRRRQAARLAN